ncbi:MAG: hypothetical protein PHU61_01465 [Candidatus Absconditabacteria bacterium]|nr:hypothetical protein [Candidatus Absconditabacteria bacterium]MDD3868032.1 hypothetical protein [Candidatus Absconditabacteria bacterium]MDD4714279.1 hypothetical protein [Candidatus Absconditabacteria bacterium]
MNLEKLFGSKAKVDILKYLLFRRQGVSMRALEGELEWTFPAIKKQVDSLEESKVLLVNKEDSAGFSISIAPQHYELFKDFFFTALKTSLIDLFDSYSIMIDRYFWGKRFGIPLDMDMIIIYKHMEKQQIDALKQQISDIFRDFFIENISIVFMSADEREKRYRLADRFVLQVMRHFPDMKEKK